MSTPLPCIRRVISSTLEASSVCVWGGAGETVGDCLAFSRFFGAGLDLGCFGALGGLAWVGFLLSLVESFSVSPSLAVKSPISPSYSELIPHSSFARLDFLLPVT